MERKINLEKMAARVEELEGKRLVRLASLFPLEALEDDARRAHACPVVPGAWSGRLVEQGERFCGRDSYLWLRKTVTVPAAGAGLRPVGRFDFGSTGGGNCSGFEAQLYIDGTPWQGVDTNHTEVMLDRFAGQTVELTFLLWSGLEGGGVPKVQEHTLACAQAGLLHVTTDELYYLLRAAVGWLHATPREDMCWEDVYGAVQRALALLDWDEEALHQTTADALEQLQAGLAALVEPGGAEVCCVGHTHIDLAWLWQLKHTREKAVRSFTTVLRLMEEFPEYTFLQSTPQLYQYVKEDAPALYDAIQAAVREGRWEADGGMWVEADCNTSSGEALARQLLYGNLFFEREFGRRCRYVWLPDAFGFSAALPQIMRQCGINTFITTKISWNQFNPMPDDLFRWRGLDGSDVVAYFINMPNSGQDDAKWYSTYNGELEPDTVLGSWRRWKNKELTKRVLVAYGHGDGGGGPTRHMLQMRRAMAALPGMKQVRCERADTYFERLHGELEHKAENMHVWDGELYLEFHRGTYTSQAQSKQWNRRLENRLAETEMLSVLAMAAGGEGQAAALRSVWEIVLRNQFHDILPGSSIREVYEDSMDEYRRAEQELQGIQAAALPFLVRPAGNHYTLFSSSGFGGSRLVCLRGLDGGALTMNGQRLPTQPGGEGLWAEVPLEPLRLVTLEHVPDAAGAVAASPFLVDFQNRHVETPFYEIDWDGEGRLTRMFDKQHGREVLRAGGLGGRLEIYEDKPVQFDNWDLDIFHTEKFDFPTLTEVTLVEDGPLRCAIRFSYAYRASCISMDMILYHGSRRVDFEACADWYESHRLLKVAFDTGLRATQATYDIQYGHIQRPTHANTSWDMARFEVLAHKWADISESNYGVSLLNDCKYGYSAREGVLRLSLLRSGKYPDTQADMGTHHFAYALLPHAGPVTQGDTIEQADWLNRPVWVVAGKAMHTAALLEVEGRDLYVDAVKPAEDGNGFVVRVHECRGGTSSERLSTGLPVGSVWACNIMEDAQGTPLPVDGWTVDATPFSLRSYRIANRQKSNG